MGEMLAHLPATSGQQPIAHKRPAERLAAVGREVVRSIDLVWGAMGSYQMLFPAQACRAAAGNRAAAGAQGCCR